MQISLNFGFYSAILILISGLIVIAGGVLHDIRIFIGFDVVIQAIYICVHILQRWYEKTRTDWETNEVYLRINTLYGLVNILFDIIGFGYMCFYNRYLYEGSVMEQIYFYASFITKILTVFVVLIIVVVITGVIVYSWTRKRKERRKINMLLLNSPVTKFINLPGLLDRDTTCSICLDDFAEGEDLRKLACEHQFHADCVDKWLKTNPICPYCRKNILSQDDSPLLANRLEAV